MASARDFRGPVPAVIFDWAGTIVDYGSCAPAEAFVETFKRHGVTIDVATARGPMGKNKRDHISEITYYSHVVAEWKRVHARAPGEGDIDAMYAAFTPVQIDAVRTRAEPIPGAVDTFAALRARGVRIGGCSGYNPEIMAALLPVAKAKGLAADAVECASGTNGRPKPWMSVRVAEALDAFPLAACVKVDDTLPGIAEGLNAGMWTVGVAESGNEMGLTAEEAASLRASEPARYARMLKDAEARFWAAGAHYVVPSVAPAHLLPVLDAIEQSVRKGVLPPA